MKYLIPHFVQEQLEDWQLHGELMAYVMFIDLSGFTPLTEGLMNKGPRGAEELSLILNDIFNPLVAMVYERSGFIPYFAGDAFTAIFPVNKAEENKALGIAFLDAALAVREYFEERSFKFSDYYIGLKIGLSYGPVEWGIVGRNSKAFYFRGAPVDASSICQALAKNQDFSIVVDNTIFRQLKHINQHFKPIRKGHYFVSGQLRASGKNYPKVEVPPLKPEIAELFLPKSIVQHSQAGEFRTVISVFISFEGVDNHRLLNRFAGVVLEQINNFSGYFKEIDFGDKGGVMVCFFGAPVSFENNMDRALEFIYTLRQELSSLVEKYQIRYRAGATIGTAYTGAVGGVLRCQYAAVGNRVNLAARLMTYADWGEVLVDAEIRKNRFFRFQHKGDIKYKGIRGIVPTYKLLGKNEDQQWVYHTVMVGRNEEMHQLIEFADPLYNGRPAGVVYLFGEAGIGKSRLTFELRKALLSTDRVQWFTCQADQILKKSFNPFIYFLRNYFEQSPEDTSDRNLQNFESRYQGLLDQLSELDDRPASLLRSELVRTKSILAALVGIVYFDSLWEQLDAKGRYQNTILAIINLLLSESRIRPLVIELEDGHWLEANSQELLHELVRQIREFPILLLITSRYTDRGTKPAFFDQTILASYQIPLLEINLNQLSPDSVRSFAHQKLRGSIGESFFDLLVRTTNCNPFYLDQLLEYFSEQNMLVLKDGLWMLRDEQIELSSSINAILTARIDRLSNLVKETVKTAAVIGREFELPVLSEVVKSIDEFAENNGNAVDILKEQITVAEQGQIWRAMTDLRYIFRHSLLREAAYSMQLQGRLQHLHQLIGEAIERLYADKLEERYFDLAFHFEQAGLFEKTCEYLRKAADYARNNYQNQKALEFYEKLLEKLGSNSATEHQVQTLLKKGRVLELIGEWDRCEEAYQEALDIAKINRDALLLGKAHDRMGRLQMLKGEYSEAMRFLKAAEKLFESIDDQQGIANVKGNLGNLYFRQGKYQEAKAYFVDSIRLGQEVDVHYVNAQIVANLGLTYMNQGLYDEGINYQQEQLKICEDNNDKQGMATIFTYMGIIYLEKGDYDQALKSFERGLELSNELGNKQLTSIAIGNIGIVYERQGDYDQAMEHYVRDLELCEELGDKQGTAIALGLIGQLLNIQGEFYRAIEYLQKTLMMCEELGYQKGIAKAVNTLGDIFYYLKQYDRSLHFYDRAIEVTRSIGNKLVLGFSLVEKGTVLLELKNQDALQEVVTESQLIAHELGNPDLIFEAELLTAKLLIQEEKAPQANIVLEALLQEHQGKDQQANTYFELYRIYPDNNQYREKALTYFQELYDETPRYSYKTRIQSLLNGNA